MEWARVNRVRLVLVVAVVVVVVVETNNGLFVKVCRRMVRQRVE